MMSLSKSSDANGTKTVPPANDTPADRVDSLSPSRNGGFQLLTGANDAQLGACEFTHAQHLYLSPPPEGSVTAEYPSGSSHDQPPQINKRKRRQETTLAMIAEEIKGNDITSLNNKYAHQLEKAMKRRKKDLDHIKGLVKRETDMVDMLCHALVTCQICNDQNHTAMTCPQRYMPPTNPSVNTVTHASPTPCSYLDVDAANRINQDLNDLDNPEAQNGQGSAN